ncbi:hypothetical protein HMPREF9071_1300 [Capnocytophaga sp. oral taxon 338 str. F0234]|nr:hypothetical protein HMPREF9071_1300 [Capnocytophaga sp. oral taxon 338 str. F0234]
MFIFIAHKINYIDEFQYIIYIYIHILYSKLIVNNMNVKHYTIIYKYI